MLAADLEDPVALPHGLEERLPFFDGVRERLLAVDVLSGGEGVQAGLPVPMVRGRNDDRVDLAEVEKPAVVASDECLVPDQLPRPRQVPVVARGCAHDPDSLDPVRGACVVQALHPEADDGDVDDVTRCGLPACGPKRGVAQGTEGRRAAQRTDDELAAAGFSTPGRDTLATSRHTKAPSGRRTSGRRGSGVGQERRNDAYRGSSLAAIERRSPARKFR